MVLTAIVVHQLTHIGIQEHITALGLQAQNELTELNINKATDHGGGGCRNPNQEIYYEIVQEVDNDSSTPIYSLARAGMILPAVTFTV